MTNKVENILNDNIGFIELVDSMGSDLTVINSARVSFGKRKTELDEQEKVILDKELQILNDEKKLKADVEFIVDNTEKLIDKKELLKEVFTNMEIDRIEKIRKLVCKKAPVKKTRGCYGITIGDGSSGEYIQLA